MEALLPRRGTSFSGNRQGGIIIAAADPNSAENNVVQGNFIGTNAAGTGVVPNSGYGIYLAGANSTTIGGTAPGAGNVISGNSTAIWIYTGSDHSIVQGNYLGTNATGSAIVAPANNASQSNTGDGIDVFSSGNTIGGTTTEARNVIVGCSGDTIDITTDDNVVQGNFLGTSITGTDIGGFHGGAGVRVTNGSNNTIGGTARGAGNTIGFNYLGVQIQTLPGIAGPPATGNAILGNAIFGNSPGIGIDLQPQGIEGVTPNSPGSPHTGPNNLQNDPVITSVMAAAGGNTTVGVTLVSTPSTAFRIEFFANPVADPSGSGQGQTFLGSSTVTTDASGNAAFAASIPVPTGAGSFITATATDPAGNTSEFSPDFHETTVNPLVVTTTADDGPGSLRAALTYANTHLGVDTITFNIADNGIQTIRPLSALPMITDPVIIDGYSEPGSSPNSLSQGDNAVILIEITGELAGTGVNGLSISAGNSTVRGLSVRGFSGGAGIHLVDQGDDTIAGDFLGIDLGADGVTLTTPVAWANNVGVQVESSQNTIGGTSPADRNVVSGNSFIEVYLVDAGATGNLVQGDFVGTNPSGTAPLATTGVGDGVDIDFGAASNTIGGTTAGARNILSGNGASGVRIAASGTNNVWSKVTISAPTSPAPRVLATRFTAS